MRIGHKHLADYKLNGVKLQEVEEERDLGITVANSLKPSSQYIRKNSSKSYASSRSDQKEVCLK